MAALSEPDPGRSAADGDAAEVAIEAAAAEAGLAAGRGALPARGAEVATLALSRPDREGSGGFSMAAMAAMEPAFPRPPELALPEGGRSGSGLADDFTARGRRARLADVWGGLPWTE
jgi:hypothetical protein